MNGQQRRRQPRHETHTERGSRTLRAAMRSWRRHTTPIGITDHETTLRQSRMGESEATILPSS